MQKIRFPLPSILFFVAVALFDRSMSNVATLLAAFMHEMGHIIMLISLDIGVKNIIILPYGLEIITKNNATSFKDEILINLSGSFVNLITFLLLLPFAKEDNFVAVFVQSHLILCVLNLMPVLCLDGGAALYAFLSQFFLPDRVNKICQIISFITLFFLWLWAVYVFMFTSYNYSLFIMCVWLFAKIFCKKY